MIEVVSKKEFTVTCSQCKGVLRYLYEDLTEGTWGDYSGDSGKWKYIVCPICAAKIEHT
jgi:hypothetical protein